MKSAKTTLYFFAVLDVFSIVMVTPQIYLFLMHFKDIPDLPLSKLRIALTVICYLTLFVSATGLLLTKKFGLITTYIQFPMRLIVWIFSFGFITYLMEYTDNGRISDWLFKIPIILEFFRLYFTIKIHKDYFR